MASTIQLDRKTADGKYIELLEVCEHLARTQCGSAVNALWVMACQSDLYAATRLELDQKGKAARSKHSNPETRR